MFLRYWESEFKILKPTRTRARQRLYHKRDLELLLEIKHLLYDEKFTIAGAKKRLQEMKKQAAAEKKAAKAPKATRVKEEIKALENRMENAASNDTQVDYRDLLIEIKKELKELRMILEG